MTRPLSINPLPGRLAICRLPPNAETPSWLPRTGFVSVTRTGSELSVVCPEAAVPDGIARSPGWFALRVQGPLPLEGTGIIAAITAPLATAGVPVFVVATYETDYILVPEAHVALARACLIAAGHMVPLDGA